MKERVIQFGEGNFLRGFVDYFFWDLKEKNLYDGEIVVVQPIEQGLCEILSKQDCNYNLFLRGYENGEIKNERYLIDIIARCINPYIEYENYLKLAENDDFEIIVSNTTEAGIEFLDTDKLEDKPAKAFPGKLTQLLYKRFKLNKEGFIILSCELIDNNGAKLKECVLKYCDLWNLEDDFKDWLNEKNYFCSTLVDRIVTGFPKDKKELKELYEEIGYEDKCIDTAEKFHLWVIEGDFEDKIQLKKAGHNIIWTDDVTPYKKRKVRILNGGHTSMVLGARLYGLTTVEECLNDKYVSGFLNKCIFEEIIPTIGKNTDNEKFGEDVIERFSNPFIKHQLLDIALNSVSKFKVRVLPTILEYNEKFGRYPEALTASLAMLIAFYKGDEVRDDKNITEFIKNSTVEEILKNKFLWDEDLSDLYEDVNKYYNLLEKYGLKKTYETILTK